MKIYFAASIRGGRENQGEYFKMIENLKKYGTVLTEHTGNKNLTSRGEDLSDADIFKRDVNWINESDVVIAEVSSPSLGVGYEIALSRVLGKPTLVLYKESEGKRLSAMIAGMSDLHICRYKDVEEALEHIDSFMRGIRASQGKLPE